VAPGRASPNCCSIRRLTISPVIVITVTTLSNGCGEQTTISWVASSDVRSDSSSVHEGHDGAPIFRCADRGEVSVGNDIAKRRLARGIRGALDVAARRADDFSGTVRVGHSSNIRPRNRAISASSCEPLHLRQRLHVCLSSPSMTRYSPSLTSSLRSDLIIPGPNRLSKNDNEAVVFPNVAPTDPRDRFALLIVVFCECADHLDPFWNRFLRWGWTN
jgi:hypothetical protein